MKTMGSASLAVVVATVLSACSGGSDSSPQTAPLTLQVTDAPIDLTEIDAVCIAFNRITVHYAGQEEVTLEYNPLASQVNDETHCLTGTVWDGLPPVPPVRLSALGGSLTVALAESLLVPVGRITWVRLHFTDNSYVLDNTGGEHPLRCPSCEPTDNNTGRGFKLNRTFEVASGGLALTIDVDLLKSLHEDSTGYVLRPTARVENTAALGTIAGTVDEALVGSTYDGLTTETGCAVYVYEGHGITPDDHYANSPVFSTARVRYTDLLGDLASRYAAGALPGGTAAQPTPYTVALTCDADDPEADDQSGAVNFTGAQDVDVVAGQTTPADFVAPP